MGIKIKKIIDSCFLLLFTSSYANEEDLKTAVRQLFKSTKLSSVFTQHDSGQGLKKECVFA